MFAKTVLNFFTPQAKKLLFAGTGLALFNNFYHQYNKDPSCCGIIGVVSVQKNVEDIIMEGIELLQNRGYDSCGIVTMKPGDKKLSITKIASNTLTGLDCIDQTKKVYKGTHSGSFIGIGHTRWATCGGKTDANAHPHFDTQERIALVHNGTLDNYKELRDELQKNPDVKLRSETDSELIAQLIGLEVAKGKDVYQATQHVIEHKLEGQWGLVIMDRDQPDRLIVARQGSPLLIGLHDDAIFIGSEKIAFEKYTSNYISLNDGEVIELELKDRHNFYHVNKNRTRVITDSQKVKIEIKPKSPFKHFFEQEISEQPEVLLRTLGNGSRISGKPDSAKLGGLEQHIENIKSIDNMVICACGSSNYAAQFAHHYFKRLRVFDSISVVEGSEFTEYDVPSKNGGMICVSQSGETADVRKPLEKAKKQGVFSIGVVNTVGSQIATTVDCCVYLACGREVAVAASKSYTAQCVALILIAIFTSYHKESGLEKPPHKNLRIQMINELRQIPLVVGLNLTNIQKQCAEIGKHLAHESSIIVLGKGPCSAIAKEGALKLKELTYIHAEAFSAGELKHGPLALIDPDKPTSTAIILFILDGEYLDEMKLALSEVYSRQAMTIVVTDCIDKLNSKNIHHVIEISPCGTLTPLLCVLPLQVLTYEICKVLGRNPDKPRNLAKTVTVN